MVRPTLLFGELIVGFDGTKQRLTSYVMYILNILFLSLYIVGTFGFAEAYIPYITIAEILLAIIFTFEYVSRLDYAENTKEEAFSIYAIADLISVFPVLLLFFIPVLGQLSFVRSLQILRVFRFLRIVLEGNRVFNYKVTDKQIVTSEVVTTIFVIITVHAGLILAFESSVNPNFNNFWDALYYSIVALTTTGFGNVVPQTVLGKLTTSIGLLLGITLIPILVTRARQTETNNKECTECGDSSHKSESNYCHQCGVVLNSDN